MTKIHPLLLSGGSGSRLWPLSRPARPKQFLPLLSEQPMIVETAHRFGGAEFAAPVLICNVEHRFLAAEALRAGGVAPARIILEPEGRNTAPAIALGALAVADKDPTALMIAAPADAEIKDLAAFQQAIDAARPAAEAGKLATFGVAPTHPETGYGYIEAGAPLAGIDAVRKITRFVEKPDADTAARYLAAGGFYWNAGLFMFRADAVLAAFREHAPEILEAAQRALANAHVDNDFTRLDPAAFAKAPSEPFDIAVMEKTEHGAVAPVDMGWSDVGGFAALWEVAEKSAAGNAIVGETALRDVRNSLVWAEPGRMLTAIGMDDIVAVATEDVTFIAPKSRAAEVKTLLAELKAAGCAEALSSATVYRPWGSYRTVEQGPGFLVKRITVKPRSKLSLQYHHHRAEHWVVVEGVATVTCGPNADELKTFDLEPNQSTYIPIGAVHRLENRYERSLSLIEVQSGHILKEEDIVRLDDAYGRSSSS
ncbi:MAG: mannose-1-phosphate guanylyltransferase/mannose-6-phosphate isomerase [Neomegalonema sp.]|nr:mannose-1-phosphate guanylyltransferase/mannose-6-phosphate isomerase [Neomegalonema sp.]